MLTKTVCQVICSGKIQHSLKRKHAQYQLFNCNKCVTFQNSLHLGLDQTKRLCKMRTSLQTTVNEKQQKSVTNNTVKIN